MRSPVRTVVLTALVLTGAALRLVGTSWGEPYGYHYDEPFVVKPALRMVSAGDPNPHFFRYPSALIYAEAAIVAALHRFSGMDLSIPSGLGYGPADLGPWTWPALEGGRWLVAAVGSAGVAAGSLLAFHLGGSSAVIVGAAFLAVLPLHAEHSHYLTTDVPATTLMVLGLALASGGLLSSRRLFGAGAILGAAVGTKYTVACALPALTLVVLLRARDSRARSLVVLAAATALGFVAVCPFSVLDWSGFTRELAAVRAHYQGGHLGAEGNANWVWYLLRLYQDGLGPAGFALIAAGVIAAAAAIRSGWPDPVHARTALILLATAFAWYGWLGAVRVRFERNLLPALTLASIVAAYGIAYVMHHLRGRVVKAAVAAAVAAAVLSCLWLSLRASLRMAGGDTRSAALAWIERNVPPGALLVREEFTPRPDPTRYRVEHLWTLAEHEPEWYVERGVDYVIASRAVYGRFGATGANSATQAYDRYQSLFRHPRAAVFVPGERRTGPIITIHAIAQRDKRP